VTLKGGKLIVPGVTGEWIFFFRTDGSDPPYFRSLRSIGRAFGTSTLTGE
jgi:hypothetical protein